ncbi:MAG: RiPP maturation radical SAM C-methyltransferase [Candidatus Aminicenantes bacterium]|nr:MAG: RiPP maturation radical SAM C-methyltransferase [Candidatus Aminicenantes bacterium]
MNVKEAERKIANLNLEGILEGGDVLLIVSPTIWTAAPIGGIHILQAACGQAGITTRVLYTNLHFSSLMDAKLHEAIAMEDHYLLEERLFAAVAFGLPPQGERIHELFEPGRVPDHLWPKGKPAPEELISSVIAPGRELYRTVDWELLESLAIAWTRTMAEQIVKRGFRIVGCSTTHGGLASAVALLNRVKKVAPNVITFIGGSLCMGEMAEGIHSLESGVDYIFSGEGDITFPEVVKKILAGHLPGEKIIYGEEVTDLDVSRLPDYREYFDQKKSFQAVDPPLVKSLNIPNLMIPYETSRGCWYNRCTFCGFREETDVYRKKSPDKVLKELTQLVHQYGKCSIYITDNMIAPQYYKMLFPRLSAEIPILRLLYEIKANMTLEELLTLTKAGAALLQSGIESLSPSLLRRMDKGVTVRENISLLRYARAVNLDLKWHLLFGFPGDQTEEYDEMLCLLPLIHHLQPPRTMLPVRIYRYSRYQRSPGEFGISHLRPAEVHKEVLPPHAHVEKLAYFFTGDYEARSFDNSQLLHSLWKEFTAWVSAWDTYKFFPLETLLPKLHITRETPDRFVLQDTRGIPGRPGKMVIDREQASLLLAACPLDVSLNTKFQWALDAGLGVLMDSWFIPLATADSSLLQEFERDY